MEDISGESMGVIKDILRYPRDITEKILHYQGWIVLSKKAYVNIMRLTKIMNVK